MTSAKQLTVSAATLAAAAIGFVGSAAEAATPTFGTTTAFTALKTGAPIGVKSTVVNKTAARQTATATITVTSASLPGYMFAKAPSGWRCAPAEIKRPVGKAVFTCTGALAARGTAVITVSSGSKIAAAAKAKAVTASTKIAPGAVTSWVASKYA